MIRFPFEVKDRDGDLVDEIMVSITTNQKRLDSAHYKVTGADIDTPVVMASWIFKSGTIGHLIQIMPKDMETKVRDTYERKFTRAESDGHISTERVNHYDSLDEAILRCLIYVASGDPDLREQRNELRYKSPRSSVPVRAHKQFSELSFFRVGFDWMKDIRSHVESWGVRPHLRYQPHGPNRSMVKLIVVKQHTRSRKESA